IRSAILQLRIARRIGQVPENLPQWVVGVVFTEALARDELHETPDAQRQVVDYRNSMTVELQIDRDVDQKEGSCILRFDGLDVRDGWLFSGNRRLQLQARFAKRMRWRETRQRSIPGIGNRPRERLGRYRTAAPRRQHWQDVVRIARS